MIKDLPYRAVFKKNADGLLIGLDFYAENKQFALDHAEQVATSMITERDFGSVSVVSIQQLQIINPKTAGVFFEAEGWRPA